MKSVIEKKLNLSEQIIIFINVKKFILRQQI